MNAPYQLLAVAVNEFRMQWRRKAMLVITLALVVVPVGFAWMLRENLRLMNTDWIASGNISALTAHKLVALALLPSSWAPTYIVLVLLLPIIVVDAVPRDRQDGLHELLNSLPLSLGIYLSGKLAGVWLSLLAGLALAMLITGASWLVLVGPFDLGLYLGMWIKGVLPLMLLNAGLAVLIAAGAANRRQAVFLGVSFAILCLILLVLSLEVSRSMRFWDLINPARPALLLYYIQGLQEESMSASVRNPVTSQDIGMTFTAGGVQLLLAWGFAWVWMQWRREA